MFKVTFTERREMIFSITAANTQLQLKASKKILKKEIGKIKLGIFEIFSRKLTSAF